MFSSTIIYTCKNFVSFGKYLSILTNLSINSLLYFSNSIFFPPLGPPDLAFPFVFVVKLLKNNFFKLPIAVFRRKLDRMAALESYSCARPIAQASRSC